MVSFYISHKPLSSTRIIPVKLPLKKQQEMFAKMLDLNQLYVNASEMEDKKFGLNKEDIKLTKDFYSKF